jgi:NAD(P)H-dependent flavin oxidoreductase YrpB (nitropropane dioxygenase family)
MLNELKIGNITVPLPIIQGGMAVRISTAPLAAAVANEGGIGIIAGTGMSIEELKAEIRKARELTSGIIGVNVLFAAREFSELVKAAISEGIDLVISGAGFSRDMFKWGKETNTPIIPVVSSAKFAQLAEKFGAAAVVVEGKEAAGHLGTDRPMFDILPEVIEAVKIPVIAAGGIIEGADIVRALNAGAAGVQMGTRFAASEESNASKEMKELYIKSKKEDVVVIDSPVGYPGRGLRNTFYNNWEAGNPEKIIKCVKCLKNCSHAFCILRSLENATTNGDSEKALMFCGENVYKIKEILPVKTIFKNLINEVNEASIQLSK